MMSTEDRLRRAITERTDQVEPAADGLANIEETLMQPTPTSSRNKLLMGGAAAALVAVVAVAAVALSGDDDSPQGVATDPAVTTTVDAQTSTSLPATATTVPPTSEPTSTTVSLPPAVPAGSVVWPRPGGRDTFDDPVAAASGFAVDYAGFDDPTIGAFAQGDTRSGEVEVRPDTGPSSAVTTVLVRQMEDDNWYVIAATTQDIQMDALGPAGDGVIACPGTVRVTGTALAFEGTVEIRIDGFGSDGSRLTIGQGFGTGAGVPPAAPFQADVDCVDLPDSGAVAATGGAVMVWEDSARDGSRRAVAARPVSFTR